MGEVEERVSRLGGWPVLFLGSRGQGAVAGCRWSTGVHHHAAHLTSVSSKYSKWHQYILCCFIYICLCTWKQYVARSWWNGRSRMWRNARKNWRWHLYLGSFFEFMRSINQHIVCVYKYIYIIICIYTSRSCAVAPMSPQGLWCSGDWFWLWVQREPYPRFQAAISHNHWMLLDKGYQNLIDSYFVMRWWRAVAKRDE